MHARIAHRNIINGEVRSILKCIFVYKRLRERKGKGGSIHATSYKQILFRNL